MKNVKRILSAVIAGALLCTGTVFSSVSAEETYLRGDTNYDGITDLDDCVDMLRFFALSLIEEDGVVSEEDWEKYCEENSSAFGFSTYEGIVANDMDGDGAITATDAVYVMKFYAYWIIFPDYTPDEIWEIVDQQLDGFVVDMDEWPLIKA